MRSPARAAILPRRALTSGSSTPAAATSPCRRLVGNAVDYAGTSFDVALQAYARGAKIVRFASTGRLPLFALATAPKAAKEIRSLKDLENRTVGVSALGNADHILAIHLMKRAGADPDRVRFATLGTNLYEPLRLGQVDAGMVQEPALTLITGGGGGVIANIMNIEEANRYLGGPYEFMGVAVRVEEREKRRDEMGRLARALAKGLRDTRTIPVKEAVAALPQELITGANRDRLAGILERYRQSLYPDNVKIDPAAVNRVADAHGLQVCWLPPSITNLCSISPSLRSKCSASQISPWVTVKNPSSKELALKFPEANS